MPAPSAHACAGLPVRRWSVWSLSRRNTTGGRAVERNRERRMNRVSGSCGPLSVSLLLGSWVLRSSCPCPRLLGRWNIMEPCGRVKGAAGDQLLIRFFLLGQERPRRSLLCRVVADTATPPSTAGLICCCHCTPQLIS
jgi:hypothetical protein